MPLSRCPIVALLTWSNLCPACQCSHDRSSLVPCAGADTALSTIADADTRSYVKAFSLTPALNHRRKTTRNPLRLNRAVYVFFFRDTRATCLSSRTSLDGSQNHFTSFQIYSLLNVLVAPFSRQNSHVIAERMARIRNVSSVDVSDPGFAFEELRSITRKTQNLSATNILTKNIFTRNTYEK